MAERHLCQKCKWQRGICVTKPSEQVVANSSWSNVLSGSIMIKNIKFTTKKRKEKKDIPASAYAVFQQAILEHCISKYKNVYASSHESVI